MSPPREYEKFTYWLSGEQVTRLSQRLKERKIRLRAAKSVVCTPLDIINKISVVTPDVWSDLCGRQGSWYRKSRRAGAFLVVSSFPLDEFDFPLNTRIRKSDFSLPRIPSADEIEQLVESEAYRNTEPEEWRSIDETEHRRWIRWLRKAGVSLEWNRLFRIHSANHANFIVPRFFIERNGRIVPHSVAPSALLCSCCLELYNVIGSSFHTKLVSPCLGALTFARFEADRYLEVSVPNCGSID